MSAKHSASRDPFRSIVTILILTIFILLMVLIFRINASLCSAQSSKEDSHQYVSIRIEKGDTLWSIAEEHAVYSDRADYMDIIRDVNGLKTDRLIEDQYLIIPVEIMEEE